MRSHTSFPLALFIFLGEACTGRRIINAYSPSSDINDYIDLHFSVCRIFPNLRCIVVDARRRPMRILAEGCLILPVYPDDDNDNRARQRDRECIVKSDCLERAVGCRRHILPRKVLKCGSGSRSSPLRMQRAG